jgi:hypothetical protein
MEMVLIRNHAAVIDLDVDQIGVDAVDGCTEGLEKHNRVIAASVTEGSEQWSVTSEHHSEVPHASGVNRGRDCSLSAVLQSLA